MYKFLLCWRYLRTRYIALASIISVMLGVATMIIVNSVMAGFTTEMQDRIHGILSDIVFESRGLEGFYDAPWHMAQIERVAGEYIEAMAPTVTVPALLRFQFRGESITRPVQLIGIDQHSQSLAGDFGKYLQHPANREEMSFDLRDGGYDLLDHQASGEAEPREQLKDVGWPLRRQRAEHEQAMREWEAETLETAAADAPTAIDPADEGSAADDAIPADPFAAQYAAEGERFDPGTEQHSGVVLGIALSSYRDRSGAERFLIVPGDDVSLTFPTVGTPPKAASSNFTVVDLYESKMSEYDASLVFVPLEELQRQRGMIEPRSGVGYVTSIQIKLKDDADLDHVRDLLREAFPAEAYGVFTWRDKQGPLLAAVQMEMAVLNILLFLIIAVAGFGILAIFFMIVVEKTRDIGVLKSLGASGSGIMGIFLGYGLSLGVVGAGVGMVLGLIFVVYINEIADLLGWVTGQEIFDPSIYYFYKIPTIIDPLTVCWIVLGAISIAVLASILPARRAARLHPVEALRYE